VIGRYVDWLARRAVAVIAVGALVCVAATYLIARHLPLRADLAYLLPHEAPAVRDLERLSQRLAARDTALVIVVAPTATERAHAVDQMAAAARALPRALVERVDTDDAAARAFVRTHRHLLVPLPRLIEARDALRAAIERGKLEANPLFIDLDEREPGDARIAHLRKQRVAAEARLDRSGFTSNDGTTGLIVVKTAFPTTDVARGAQLLGALATQRDAVRASYPRVEIGFTGGVPTTVTEHAALVEGIVASAVITAVLVVLLLLAYFRSVRLVVLLAIPLFVATALAFGIAVFTVGHLNAATAFLGAIIAGNGINYGTLLLARLVEEQRTTTDPVAAMTAAMTASLRPTLVASLGAAIAYGSLAATSFRGFADFATVGAVGMVLCWVASFTLLPALLLRFAARTPRDTASWLGRALVATFGSIPVGALRGGIIVLVLVAGIVSARYIGRDPFEYDLRNLRSSGTSAAESRNWMEISNRTFGKSISGRAYIAADRPDQVPQIVDALREVERDRPEDLRAIGGMSSILDVVPLDQAERIAVLREIRALLDDPAIATLDDDPRRELDALRPPETLHPLTADDLPDEIRDQLVERDGRIGLLIAVQPGPSLNQWNGIDLVRFANAVRTVRLANGETITTSGSSVVFADILKAIERDGPRVSAIAGALLAVMVLVIVGINRRGLAVLAATALGTLGMIAVCAVAGLKVNFLDFIALPITLGLGVDYAVNLASRSGEIGSARIALRTSGAAIVVCSLTTIIGYGSLLVSQNLAIRGFGFASLVGELTCLVGTLLVVPAFAVRRDKSPARVA